MVFTLPTSWMAGYSLRVRLYSIIAFLGFLPIIGAALVFSAFQTAQRDHADLDRAARGTIHLEHINALVYAVVMESRGIYMSADWKAAEPFAKKLVTDLAELQETARAWKTNAIGSQRGNVDELSKRIDQFVGFRTELVRLGKKTAPVRRDFLETMTPTARSARRSMTASMASPERTRMRWVAHERRSKPMIARWCLHLARWPLLPPWRLLPASRRERCAHYSAAWHEGVHGSACQRRA